MLKNPGGVQMQSGHKFDVRASIVNSLSRFSAVVAKRVGEVKLLSTSRHEF